MNRRIARRALAPLLAGVLAALTGCASVPANLDMAYAGSDAGKVVLSLSTEPSAYFHSYTLLIRQSGTGAQPGDAGAFSYKPGSPMLPARKDFGSDDELGQVLSATLPAGRYEIHAYKVVLNPATTTMQERSLSSQPEFSIPFEIKPKQTTYLGSYWAHQLSVRNALGISVPSGVQFRIDSARERDLEVLRKRMESVREPVTDATPDAAALHHPALLARDRSKE